MALSKKHYEQFAFTIKTESERAQAVSYYSPGEKEAARQALQNYAVSMAVHFALDNPRFDRERFLKACGF